jgi:acetylornithine deacetylase/succinyl-diaminopimelate desuccinylase-like protein
LKADIALICDTGLFEGVVPAITTMLRGLLGEEFTVHAATRDLHSGMYGGLRTQPDLHVLAKLLAGLHDDQGRITVPGFYDDVAELPDALRAQWQALSFDHARYPGRRGPVGARGRGRTGRRWK